MARVQQRLGVHAEMFSRRWNQCGRFKGRRRVGQQEFENARPTGLPPKTDPLALRVPSGPGGAWRLWIRRTRHAPQPVINKPCEAETMLASGRTVVRVLQHLGLSEATFDRSRNPCLSNWTAKGLLGACLGPLGPTPRDPSWGERVVADRQSQAVQTASSAELPTWLRLGRRLDAVRQSG